ncbi:hypothetical protein [Gordonia sp. FQ]
MKKIAVIWQHEHLAAAVPADAARARRRFPVARLSGRPSLIET